MYGKLSGISVILFIVLSSLISCSDKKTFGISYYDKMLGSFDQYESYLNEKGFTNKGIVTDENIAKAGSAYLFTLPPEANNFTSKVVVIITENESVIAVNADFPNDPGNKAMACMTKLWKTVSGAQPGNDTLIKPGTSSSKPVWGSTYSDYYVHAKWEIFDEWINARLALTPYATATMNHTKHEK